MGWKDFASKFDQKNDKYKGRSQYKDVIRVLTEPEDYFLHIIGEYPKSKVIVCGTPTGKRCLACEAGIETKIKGAAIIAHIKEKKEKESDFSMVNELKVWCFGGDKARTIAGILEDYPHIERDGLNKHDLYVTTVDEGTQKLEIRPTMVDSELKSAVVQAGKERTKKDLEFLMSPTKIDKQREILGMDPDADDGVDDDCPFDIPERNFDPATDEPENAHESALKADYEAKSDKPAEDETVAGLMDKFDGTVVGEEEKTATEDWDI